MTFENTSAVRARFDFDVIVNRKKMLRDFLPPSFLSLMVDGELLSAQPMLITGDGISKIQENLLIAQQRIVDNKIVDLQHCIPMYRCYEKKIVPYNLRTSFDRVIELDCGIELHGIVLGDPDDQEARTELAEYTVKLIVDYDTHLSFCNKAGHPSWLVQTSCPIQYDDFSTIINRRGLKKNLISYTALHEKHVINISGLIEGLEEMHHKKDVLVPHTVTEKIVKELLENKEKHSIAEWASLLLQVALKHYLLLDYTATDNIFKLSIGLCDRMIPLLHKHMYPYKIYLEEDWKNDESKIVSYTRFLFVNKLIKFFYYFERPLIEASKDQIKEVIAYIEVNNVLPPYLINMINHSIVLAANDLISKTGDNDYTPEELEIWQAELLGLGNKW